MSFAMLIAFRGRAMADIFCGRVFRGLLVAGLLSMVAACAGVARPVRRLQRGKRHPMDITDYRRGRHLVAQTVTVHRLGHAWSGGAAGQPFSDALGPDASRLAWAFVSKAWAQGLP